MRQEIHRDAAARVGQLRELMAPEMAVQQHPMDEERDRPRALFGVADASRGRLNAVPGRRCSVAVHGSLPPRRRREALRLLEPARAVLAAHLNRLAADLQLDGVCIQLAVASRTGLLCHDTAPRMDPPHSGSDEEATLRWGALSESLAIGC